MARTKDKISYEDKKKKAYTFFVSKGYTPQQSAGIVANLIAESSLDTKIKGDNGNSHGIAQWNKKGSPERHIKFEKKYGKTILESSFDEQLEYIDWELKNTETGAYKALQETNTASEAALIFSKKYERPHEDWARNEERQATASKIANQYAGIPLENLTTIENTKEKSTFARTQGTAQNYKIGTEKNQTEVVSPEVNIEFNKPASIPDVGVSVEKEDVEKEDKISAAQQRINQRVAERNLLINFLKHNQYQAPEYRRTNAFATAPPQQVMQKGGEVKLDKGEGELRTVNISSKEYRDLYEKEMLQSIDPDTGDILIGLDEVVLPAIKKGQIGLAPIPNYEGIGDFKDERALQQRTSSTIPEKGEERVLGKIEGEEAEIIDLDGVLEKITPKDTIPGKVDKSIDNLTLSEYKSLNEEDLKKVNKELADKGFHNNVLMPKGKEEIMEVQRLLVKENYDLGKYGKDRDGVDGIIGRKTKKALEDYNNKQLAVLNEDAFKNYTSKGDSYIPSDDFKPMTSENDVIVYQDYLQNKGLMQASLGDYDINFDENNLENKEIEFKKKIPEFEIYEKDKCEYGKECATFITWETLNTVGVDMFEESQVRGDAWTMNEKMKKSGGQTLFSVFDEEYPDLKSKKEIGSYIESKLKNAENFDTSTLKDGDVIHLYYKGSDFTEEAYKEREGEFATTHVGMVKTDKNGNKIVEHNVGGKIYRDSIESVLKGRKIGRDSFIKLSGVTRPKYNLGDSQKVNYYETSSPYTINFDKVTKADSPLLKKNISVFQETLGRNLGKLQEDLGLEDKEARALVKATTSIAWKESYGNEKVDNPKLSEVDSLKGMEGYIKKALAPVRENFGGTEASKGFTQMKDEKNLNNTLRENLLEGNDGNLYDPRKSSIASYYAVGTRFKYLKDLTNKAGLSLNTDELVKLSMLGWNEDISVVGKSILKYKDFDTTIKEYRKNKKTGKEVGHNYDLALDLYDTAFKLR